MLDYIDKNYSMRETLMCGAMKPVSLLFDQPTYSMWFAEPFLCHHPTLAENHKLKDRFFHDMAHGFAIS